MTVREEFDAFSLNQTIAAGAELRKITRSMHSANCLMSWFFPPVWVTYSRAFWWGADGANSQIRGLVGHARWFRVGFALEGQVDCCSDALRGSGHDDCPFACHT